MSKKEWYFLLQQVYFNNHYTAHDCPYLGSPKTQPQILKWKATYTLNSNHESIIVALPGQFHSVLLSTIDVEKKFFVFYDWIETVKKVRFVTRRDGRTILQGIYNDVEDDYSRHITPIFPEYLEYKRQEYIVNSSGFIYYIVKYFDTVHNYKYIYEKTYFHPCPNFTHNPKLFSWNQAAQLCGRVHTTLPEFITRREQEEFLHILKVSPGIFPMESIFIGLKQKRMREKVIFLKFNQCKLSFI